MEMIVLWVICGGVTAIIASSKNRNWFGWLLIGLLIGIFGLILVVVLPAAPREEGKQRGRDPEGYDHPNADKNRGMDMRKLGQKTEVMDMRQWRETVMTGEASGWKGDLTLPDGARYEGEIRDGKAHGQGVFTFPDGARYEGEVRDGKAHGQGVFTFPDGARYEGVWRDGEPKPAP